MRFTISDHGDQGLDKLSKFFVTVHAPEFDASLSVFLPVPFSYACSRVERRSVAARDLSLFVCCCFALVAIRLLFC